MPSLEIQIYFYSKIQKVVLGDHGFMVLVGLRGLRSLHTKFAQPPRPFPTHQPRAHKMKPKSVCTLHEGSSKRSQNILLLPTQG